MTEIIAQLNWALTEADKYKTGDKSMEYAYKYGLLRGVIASAINELEYLKTTKK
jgi:hypothetical protein